MAGVEFQGYEALNRATEELQNAPTRQATLSRLIQEEETQRLKNKAIEQEFADRKRLQGLYAQSGANGPTMQQVGAVSPEAAAQMPAQMLQQQQLAEHAQKFTQEQHKTIAAVAAHAVDQFDEMAQTNPGQANQAWSSIMGQAASSLQQQGIRSGADFNPNISPEQLRMYAHTNGARTRKSLQAEKLAELQQAAGVDVAKTGAEHMQPNWEQANPEEAAIGTARKAQLVGAQPGFSDLNVKPQYDQTNNVMIMPKPGGGVDVERVGLPKAQQDERNAAAESSVKTHQTLKAANDSAIEQYPFLAEKAKNNPNFDAVSELIKMGTGSSIGERVDDVARAAGHTTPGMAANAALEPVFRALVAAAPRPSGAQSDAELGAIEKQFAKIQDPGQTEGEKLSSWHTVKDQLKRWEEYGAMKRDNVALPSIPEAAPRPKMPMKIAPDKQALFEQLRRQGYTAEQYRIAHEQHSRGGNVAQ